MVIWILYNKEDIWRCACYLTAWWGGQTPFWCWHQGWRERWLRGRDLNLWCACPTHSACLHHHWCVSLCVRLQGVCVVWLHQTKAATHSTHASFSSVWVCVCKKRGSQNSDEKSAREKEEEKEEEEEGRVAKIRQLCFLTYGSEESMIEKKQGETEVKKRERGSTCCSGWAAAGSHWPGRGRKRWVEGEEVKEEKGRGIEKRKRERKRRTARTKGKRG